MLDTQIIAVVGSMLAALVVGVGYWFVTRITKL